MKNYAKKLPWIILLLLSLTLSFASCGGGGTGSGSGGEGSSEGDKTDAADVYLDLESLDNITIGSNLTHVGDYDLSANPSSSASIAVCSPDGVNKMLELKKNNVGANTPLTVTLTVPENAGDWFVFKTDITIDQAIDGHATFDLSIGRMYALRFYVYNQNVLMYDYNESDFVNLLGTVGKINETFEVYVQFNNGDGVTRDENGELVANDMQADVYINGRYFATSSNFFAERHLTKENMGNVALAIPKETEATVYLDNITASKKYNPVTVNEQPSISVGIPTARTFWDERLRTYAEIVGSEGAEAFLNFSNEMYEDKLYIWLASLYDPDSGMFYYSESARNSFSFMPMAESISPVMNIIVSLGICDDPSLVLTKYQMMCAASWAQLYHSNRDGYFYHPQWGTDVSDTVRNRDIDAFENVINLYGFGEYFFSDAYFRAGRGGQRGKLHPMTYQLASASAQDAASRVLACSSEVTLAGMYDSSEEFVAELDKQWENSGQNSLTIGNYLYSRVRSIQRYGLVSTCLTWLEAKQQFVQDSLVADGRAKNGLWEVDVTYRSVLGAYYIASVYNSFRSPMKYTAEMLDSVISYVCAAPDEVTAAEQGIIYTYYPLYAVRAICTNVDSCHSASLSRQVFRNVIMPNAAKIVEASAARLQLFKKEDGSFSYLPNSSAESWNGVVSAIKDTNEGDINASSCAFTVRYVLLDIFKLPDYPILTPYSTDIYFDVDGDGEKEIEGHLNRFRALIDLTEKPEKVDTGYLTTGEYNFTDESQLPQNDYPEIGSYAISDGALIVTDNVRGNGFSAAFEAGKIESKNREYLLATDIKFIGEPTTEYAYQLFVGDALKLDCIYKDGKLTFCGRYIVEGVGGESKEFLTDKDGNNCEVNPMEWFRISISVYPDKITVDGKDYVAKVTLTQGDTTAVSYLEHARSAGAEQSTFETARVYSLMANTGSIALRNLECKNYISCLGNYNFDRIDTVPTGVTGGSMILGDDNMLDVSGETVKLEAAKSGGAFNFNEVQFTFRIPERKVGDEGFIVLKDSSDREITSLKYVVQNGYFEIRHAISNQVLLITPAALQEDVTIRFEYHYDMSKPTVNVLLRYADSMNFLISTKPMSLESVPLTNAEADASDFTYVEISGTAEQVIIDDVIVRNVRK